MTVGTRPQLIRGVRISGPTAQLLPDDGAYDLQLFDGRITDIAPTGNLRVTGDVFDADGLWAIPGLWDHHVHFSPWALRSRRTSLLHCASARDAAAIMGAVAPDANGLRIGIEFRDALWPDAPTLEVLDAATGDVPTYLINMDLHSVWLNSAAFSREQLTAPADGVLREDDAFRVARALDAIPATQIDEAAIAASADAAARGIVGFVDLDMAWNAEAWQRRAAAGFNAQRVRFGIYPQHLQRAITEGLVSGEDHDEAGLIRVGGLKVITDGSLGTRTAACRHSYGPHDTTGLLTVAQDELDDLLTAAAGAGLEVFVHAIGDQAVSNALDAFARSGAVGTLEHAQLVAHADVQRLVRLGVTASLQPTHAVDDRDVADREWAEQRSLVYPQRTLFDAGANVVFGSDAPVATLDPWLTIANAVARSNDERDAWYPAEAVSAVQALAASTALGSLGGVDLSPGTVADIALCEIDPYASSADDLRTMRVGATIVDGLITHVG